MAVSRDELERLRDVLWVSIQEADPEKRAPLAAQYRATLHDLAVLADSAGKAGDPIDEIAARRSRRGGSAAG